MKYFRWSQNGYSTQLLDVNIWYLERIDLIGYDQWSLKTGKVIENWDENTTAFFSTEADHTDFPFSAYDLPIYSPKLSALIKNMRIKQIQYLPIKIRNSNNNNVIHGYCIANYLSVIDCLDRDHSDYQVWTKNNLLFWEERSWMLGTFRDVKKAVLDKSKIGDGLIFRLQGWEVMVIVREDIKQEIEKAKITGCVFTEIETI